MKKYLIADIIVVLSSFLLCLIISLTIKKSNYLECRNFSEVRKLEAYTDIVVDDDVNDDQKVEDFIKFAKKNSDNPYPKAAIIIEAKDNYRFYQNSFIQDVEILSLVDGSENIDFENSKDTIFVVTSGFSDETSETFKKRKNELYGYFGEENVSNKIEKPSTFLNMRGLNIMKPGHRYLVFVSYTDYETNTMLFAIPFQYSWFDLDNEQKAVPIIPCDIYYTDFSENIDNEIFAESDKILDDYYRLKEEVITYYGIS